MDGHSGSPDRTAITVAKRLRRALDRVHSTGVLGPRHRLPSGRVAPDTEGLFRILRKMPYASVARKRCTCQPTCRASLTRSCNPDSKSRRPASSLHASSCLIENDFQTLASKCRTTRVLVCYGKLSFCGRTLARWTFDPGHQAAEY